MYHLNQIYKEVKDGVWSVIELNRQNRDLEGEQVRLEVGNKQAATTFQQFADHTQKDRKVIVGYTYTPKK